MSALIQQVEMFKILRVNMSDLSVKAEDVPEEYQGRGGRGLTSAIVVEGLPQDDKIYKLFVGKDKYELSPADDLKGLGNYVTVDKLKG